MSIAYVFENKEELVANIKSYAEKIRKRLESPTTLSKYEIARLRSEAYGYEQAADIVSKSYIHDISSIQAGVD